MHGSAALDLAWLAAGRLHATVMLSNLPWDVTAGLLLVREAGGVVFDYDGSARRGLAVHARLRPLAGRADPPPRHRGDVMRVGGRADPLRHADPRRTRERRADRGVRPVTDPDRDDRAGPDRPEVHVHAGGQGFWVARMAAKLGAEVALCCALGGEPGRVLPG